MVAVRTVDVRVIMPVVMGVTMVMRMTVPMIVLVAM